jgi:hypothetical protein
MYTERMERSGYVYNEQLQIYVSVIFYFAVYSFSHYRRVNHIVKFCKNLVGSRRKKKHSRKSYIAIREIVWVMGFNATVLPSTGFEPTPLLHCSIIRLALRPAP